MRSGRMARPARATGAVAVTLLLTLVLLLLPAPASSQLPALALGFLRTPAARQLGKTVAKEVAKAAGEAVIKQSFAHASASANVNLLGSAAAADAAYIVYNVSIGTAPEHTFYGVVDILHDFLWVSCPPEPPFQSLTCDSQTCMQVLDITAADCDSSADGGGDCSYKFEQATTGENTTGFLAVETFTVGAENIAEDALFGCSGASTLTGGRYGAFGFSKGKLSILRQLKISRFSYFLAPVSSDIPFSGSAVLVGDQAVPQTKRSRSTPLFGSKAHPNLYFVQLTDIQVDGVSVPGIPAGAFDLAADESSGGVVLSTTVFCTYLQESAYSALKQALVGKIGAAQVSSDVFDLCYHTQSVATLTFPKITLVFGGADSPAMDLTTVNFFFKDSDTGLQCLTILPTPDDTPFGSILGSMLQAGTNMIYDTDAAQLTFETSVAVVAATVVPSQLAIASLLLVWVLLF